MRENAPDYIQELIRLLGNKDNNHQQSGLQKHPTQNIKLETASMISAERMTASTGTGQIIMQTFVETLNHEGYHFHAYHSDLILKVISHATSEELSYVNRNIKNYSLSGVTFWVEFGIGKIDICILEDSIGGSDELRHTMIISLINDFEEIYKEHDLSINPVLVGYKDSYRVAIEKNKKKWNAYFYNDGDRSLVKHSLEKRKNVPLSKILRKMESKNYSLAKNQ